jgi:hypothetical protein
MVPAAALLRWRMGATFSAARVFPSRRVANRSVPAVPKLVLAKAAKKSPALPPCPAAAGSSPSTTAGFTELLASANDLVP